MWRVSRWKFKFIYWVYIKFQALVMRDWQLSEIIFDTAFECLKAVKESGELDDRDWDGDESRHAERELNQCYIWYVQVRPVELNDIRTLEDLESFVAYDQQMLERLIKVREWL